MTQELRRIAVYGGTFDPIHYGHLKTAEVILTNFEMDRLIFVPAYTPPHKKGRKISSSYHRAAMLTLATSQASQMLVSSIELEHPERPYTIDTLIKLRETYNDTGLYFCMGADSFKEFSEWKDYKRILNEFSIIVACRPGIADLDEAVAFHKQNPVVEIIDLRGGIKPPDMLQAHSQIYLIDYAILDVSATLIRDKASRGESIVSMVPHEVAAYIEKYELYRN